MTIHEDFLKELSKNKKAEAIFMGPNRPIFSLLNFAFRPQKTRDKRMKEIIEMLAKGVKLH